MRFLSTLQKSQQGNDGVLDGFNLGFIIGRLPNINHYKVFQLIEKINSYLQTGLLTHNDQESIIFEIFTAPLNFNEDFLEKLIANIQYTHDLPPSNKKINRVFVSESKRKSLDSLKQPRRTYYQYDERGGILENPLRESPQSATRSFFHNKCGVCLVKFEEFQNQQNQIQIFCGHMFHKECLVTHFKYLISEKKIPLSCPMIECRLQCTEKDVKNCLNQQDMQKLDKLSSDLNELDQMVSKSMKRLNEESAKGKTHHRNASSDLEKFNLKPMVLIQNTNSNHKRSESYNENSKTQTPSFQKKIQNSDSKALSLMFYGTKLNFQDTDHLQVNDLYLNNGGSFGAGTISQSLFKNNLREKTTVITQPNYNSDFQLNIVQFEQKHSSKMYERNEHMSSQLEKIDSAQEYLPENYSETLPISLISNNQAYKSNNQNSDKINNESELGKRYKITNVVQNITQYFATANNSPHQMNSNQFNPNLHRNNSNSTNHQLSNNNNNNISNHHSNNPNYHNNIHTNPFVNTNQSNAPNNNNNNSNNNNNYQQGFTKNLTPYNPSIKLKTQNQIHDQFYDQDLKGPLSSRHTPEKNPQKPAIDVNQNFPIGPFHFNENLSKNKQNQFNGSQNQGNNQLLPNPQGSTLIKTNSQSNLFNTSYPNVNATHGTFPIQNDNINNGTQFNPSQSFNYTVRNNTSGLYIHSPPGLQGREVPSNDHNGNSNNNSNFTININNSNNNNNHNNNNNYNSSNNNNSTNNTNSNNTSNNISNNGILNNKLSNFLSSFSNQTPSNNNYQIGFNQDTNRNNNQQIINQGVPINYINVNPAYYNSNSNNLNNNNNNNINNNLNNNTNIINQNNNNINNMNGNNNFNTNSGFQAIPNQNNSSSQISNYIPVTQALNTLQPGQNDKLNQHLNVPPYNPGPPPPPPHPPMGITYHHQKQNSLF